MANVQQMIEQFKQTLNSVVIVKKLDEKTKLEILNYYIIMADAYYEKNNEKAEEALTKIQNNLYTFNILSSKTIYQTFIAEQSQPYYNDNFRKKSTNALKMLDNAAKAQEIIESLHINQAEIISLEDINKALGSYGVEQVNTNSDSDRPTDEEISQAEADAKAAEELEDFANSIFDNPEDIERTLQEINSKLQYTDEENEEEDNKDGQLGDTTNSDNTYNTEGKQLEDNEDNNSNTPLDNFEDSDPEHDELLKDIKNAWEEKLEDTLKGIMVAYDKLYKPGYGIIPPVGILTDQGIIKSTTDGRIAITGSQAKDIEVYLNLVKVLGDKYTMYAKNGEEPDIDVLMHSNLPIIYTDMHLKFMFGHLNFCKGRKYGLRHYLTEHNIKNDSSDKIIKYESIRGWIKETVENYFYESYIKLGIKNVVNNDTISEVNVINEKISASLKNVIVVVERKKGVNTKLRICSDSAIDVNKIITMLKNNLNTGSSSLIDVQQVGKYENGIVDINIIYNAKAFSQDALFAYQVLEILKEQDIRPRWDNVIMGKTDDGNIMTYNFKDSNNSVIALYGSKGSGKGVMTLNLIASALADDCTLMYMDAKPDTAIPLCKVVWDKGLDAVVFNGKETPGAELEKVGCPRKVDRFIAKKYIPEGLFKVEESLEKFILLTTYYRGIELFLDLAEARASVVTNGGHNEDWLVAIFDEVQQLAKTEATVCKQLEDAQKAREKATEEVNGKVKKINYMQDSIWKFVEEYKAWRAIIADRLATAIGSTFRKAEVTSIYIWQTSDYPGSYTHDSLIAEALMKEAGSVVKIMGRGAAAANGGSIVYGTTSNLAKDATWYDSRFTGKNGGYWAIGNSVNTDSAMTVFRPFNVYSNASDKELLIRNAEAAGLSEQDLIGVSLNADGSVIKEIGFEAYSDKLLAMSGKTAAIQLNLGYKRIEKFIKEQGLASSVCDYMYNFSDHTNGNENNNTNSTQTVRKGVDLSNEFNSKPNSDSIQLANAEQSRFTPVQPSRAVGMSQSAQSDIDNALARKPIELKIMPYSHFASLDNNSKQANIDRALKELTNNRFNTNSRENKSFGLIHLCWNISILHASNMINTDVLNQSIATFVINYCLNLDNGTYKYDYIPNKNEVDELNTRRDAAINNDGSATESPNFYNNTRSEINSEFINETSNQRQSFDGSTMQEPPRDKTAFSQNPAGRNNIDTSALMVPPIKLDSDNSIDIDPSEGKTRFMQMLSRSINGTSYLFTQRTKSVIDAIIKAMKDKNVVKRVSIKEKCLVVNGRFVDTDPLINDEYGIRFEDFVIVKDILDAFPNIENIVLDYDMFTQVVASYGDDAQSLWTIFQQNRKLNKMEIQCDPGSEFTAVTRQSFTQQASNIQSKAKKNKFKQQIETVSASHNPRLAEKGIGYAKSSFDIASSMGSNFKKQLTKSNPNLFKAGLYGAVAGVFGIAGVAIGLPSSLFKMFKR